MQSQISVKSLLKASILGLFFLVFNAETSRAQNPGKVEQEIITLSKDKWQWMSDKNVDKLGTLFNEKSMFVHMGGSWGKSRELDVIKSGNIWYKKATVHSASVNFIGNTAILLNDLDLVAVVGGQEPGHRAVVNPFMVSEVYVHENGKWTMRSLTFSKLARPVK